MQGCCRGLRGCSFPCPHTTFFGVSGRLDSTHVLWLWLKQCAAAVGSPTSAVASAAFCSVSACSLPPVWGGSSCRSRMVFGNCCWQGEVGWFSGSTRSFWMLILAKLRSGWSAGFCTNSGLVFTGHRWHMWGLFGTWDPLSNLYFGKGLVTLLYCFVSENKEWVQLYGLQGLFPGEKEARCAREILFSVFSVTANAFRLIRSPSSLYLYSCDNQSCSLSVGLSW